MMGSRELGIAKGSALESFTQIRYNGERNKGGDAKGGRELPGTARTSC